MYAQTATNMLVYSRFAAVLFFRKISKMILKFSITCITSMPVSSLYNIVSQIFVGRGNDFIPYGRICHKCSLDYHPAEISWGYRGSVLRPIADTVTFIATVLIMIPTMRKLKIQNQ